MRKEEELSGKDKNADGKDPLTGLYRRSEFFRTAESFLREIEDKSYCLMVIDIEHFKLFNQWYGEAEGDHCPASEKSPG